MTAIRQKNVMDGVREELGATLMLGARGPALQAASPLLGALPELDSMAVMALVAGLEERFDIVFEDEDIHARSFATLASLAALVEGKLQAGGRA